MVTAPTARTRKKRKTREQLLEAAFNVFCQQGITNTRMGDIADAASVAHGTVFLHFSSKDEMISEVIKAYSGRIALRLHDMVKEKATVRDILEAHIQGLGEFEDFYFRLVSEASQLPQSARTTMIGIQSAVSIHLAEAAKHQIERGEIRPVETALLFNTWIGLVNHYVLNRTLFAPTGSVLHRWGAALVDHYLGLLSY
ncbi:MAG: TetR family transcriptional regulator [Phycisphaerales bacterium]|nr:TetR family transcriptional regulator [Phycisphaerales bacterium]MCB9862650.1 TetR family transcriptional regulator [Phycisphaerales bacterium]